MVWSHRQARVWGLVSLVAIPLLPAGAALSGALQGWAIDFDGGLSAASVLYAFWEPFVAWEIMAVLLLQFRLRFNALDARRRCWSDAAFGAFVIHAPVVVALSVLLSPWTASPLVKFCLVAASGTVLSFLMSRALRALPFVSRVL